MAKFIRHDFGAIHEALNKLIIAEVKTALMELPGKCICWDGKTPLCHIVVSLVSDYEPENLAVRSVFLRKDGTLSFVASIPDSDNEWHANEEDADWLDITDFGYLIDQIAQKVEEDKTVYIVNKRIAACEIVPEFDLGTAIHRTI